MCDEQRRAVAEDVVVVCAAARVDQKQPVAVRQPVLLRIVAAQFRAVVKRPRFERCKMEPVVTGGHVAFFVIADRQVVASPELNQGGLVASAGRLQREFVAVFEVGQLCAVKSAMHDGRCRARLCAFFAHFGRAVVLRHEQRAIVFGEPLRAPGARAPEFLLVRKFERAPGVPLVRFRVVYRVGQLARLGRRNQYAVSVAHRVADSQQFPAGCVPPRHEIADPQRNVVRERTPPQCRLFLRRRPGLPEIL